MESGNVAENKNVQLQGRNEKLSHLTDLQESTGKLPASKPDLSARMVFDEEEKLKISKDLVDLQIETNKMKEQHETESFELKTMLLALEQRVLELELRGEKVSGERDALREQLQALESRRKELADEYIILKSNYLALGKELEQEVMKNEELSRELLSLASARSTRPRAHSHCCPATAHGASAQLEGVRAALNTSSVSQQNQAEDPVTSAQEQQKLKGNLLGNQDQIKAELEQLKKAHDSQQQKLEERVLVLGKELQEAKGAIGATQQKLAEQSAVLLSSQSQLQEVEAENSQLQLGLKALNEEYRGRLAQHSRDVADYMDSKSSQAPGDARAMRGFVDRMLGEIRASYRSREEQLARAARGYKKRMKNVVKKHENLLIAYGRQREQLRALGSSAGDCGPAELHFAITDPELLTNTTQELNRLREAKAKLEMQLQDLQKVVAEPLALWPQLGEEGWAQVRQQLREFTRTTQAGLEQERSQLLTRAVAAEEQVSELQEYVEKHLARYKQELLRLQEAPRARTASQQPQPGPESKG
ncbi:coiled-coil domain-containing protein 78 [Colius striatus]|uniref:coiled-coil domain-containing protein 78 n=1 Tax=Colius striatus TaxID=57412 RepID=UPI002B1E6393|nr:coiled-coil domain-containing protein 78 [Colius striatus]